MAWLNIFNSLIIPEMAKQVFKKELGHYFKIQVQLFHWIYTMDPIYGHLRHGLKNGLHAVSKGKLADNFLLSLAKVNLPGVLANGLGQLDVAAILIADIVE